MTLELGASSSCLQASFGLGNLVLPAGGLLSLPGVVLNLILLPASQTDSVLILNVSSFFFILLSGTRQSLKSVWLRMCEAQEQAKLTPVEMEIR